MKRVLYITYDGILEPLGQSQVLNYLESLSDRHQIHLMSFEKKEDIRNIDKLNNIKGRKSAMSVIMSDKNMVFSCTDISQKNHKMVKKYLKGQTTIILKIKSGIVHPNILGEEKTLGIRIPDHNFGPRLCKELGFPITTTSVNRAGETPLNDPNKIIKIFNGEFDILIDNGAMKSSTGSTIYKLEKSIIKVIRR